MNSTLVKLVVGFLRLLLRLLILAITGEWVDLDKLGKSPQPTPPPRPGVDTQTPDRALAAQRFEELRSRQSAESQEMRAHYEGVARAFAAPLAQRLRELGVGLRKRAFVVLARTDPADASLLRDAREHTRYWPVVVASGQGDSLAPYVAAAHGGALALAVDAPGLLNRVRLAHGWPSFLLLPGVERPDLLRGAFGVWLGPLLADVLLTLQLGPGYTQFLSRSPGSSLAASAPTRFLHEEPPHLLRLYASLGTLEFLGYFEDAERIEGMLAHRVGDAPDLILSTSVTGHAQKLPYELWRAELQGLLQSILEDVQPALGGDSLLDAPGVAFLHGEQARALRLSPALSRDEPGRTAPGRHTDASVRDWLAAALLLSAQENVGGLLSRGSTRFDEGEIARRLRRILGGPAMLEPAELAGSASRLQTQDAAPRGFAAMLRDPQVVHDAVVLGALLGPQAKTPGRRVRGPFGR